MGATQNRFRMSLAKIIVLLMCSHWVCGIDTWQKPGCHKVGHRRDIGIPDCVEFTIETNACRGYCHSYAVPSVPFSEFDRVWRPVRSIGECCNIMESEDVFVNVNCLDGPKNITFKSASKCSCYHCKKN